MLVGEPEGKTAIAEGLPIELKNGDVKEVTLKRIFID
jgi:ATP-dependent Clp protease ATP-binding subunit ClpA